MTTLVLASASPARRATLVAAGIDPVVRVSSVDEDSVVAGYGVAVAEDIALVLARAKAEDVAAGEEAGALVVGCDSVLELDGEVHGKPGTTDRAVERWRRMRGRTGVLHTGHWLVDTRHDEDGGSGATLGAVASTRVHFADLADDEIEAYVATGEPLRVAGAFTQRGLSGPFIDGIDGDSGNVTGISLPLFRKLLGELGLTVMDLWA
jgi:septum formation protein